MRGAKKPENTADQNSAGMRSEWTVYLTEGRAEPAAHRMAGHAFQVEKYVFQATDAARSARCAIV